MPDGIDLEIVACLMTKGLTTFYLLHKTYPVKKGQTVLFHAAAGGVGQIFCQWAKSLGCTVIGTVGSDEKIEIAKEYGCAHVINYNKDDFQKEVMKITGNQGLPVVYDGVGKKTFEKNTALIITWGGLRGGLSIALALNLPDSIGTGKDLILILTYGVVLFTILVQGLTLKKIVK